MTPAIIARVGRSFPAGVVLARAPIKIVVGDVHSNGRFKVPQFLAEGQSQTAEPLHKHSCRTVETLDVAGAYCPQIGYELDRPPVAFGDVKWPR